MPSECAWLSTVRVKEKGDMGEQGVWMCTECGKSCGHWRFLYGCKNKLPSLNQETLAIQRNWFCKESVSLHKAVQSNQVFGPQPYSSRAIRLPQAARDLSAETFWVYFSSHKILHYFLSVLELCLSIFNPKQQKQPARCILGWNNINCLQKRHLNSLGMHSICSSKYYCKVEYF